MYEVVRYPEASEELKVKAQVLLGEQLFDGDSELTLRDILEEDPNCYLFVDSDGVFALGALGKYKPEKSLMRLELILVNKDQRGHGFGREMLELLENEAMRITGEPILDIELNAANGDAADFFYHHGYYPDPNEDGVMLKTILESRM